MRSTKKTHASTNKRNSQEANDVSYTHKHVLPQSRLYLSDVYNVENIQLATPTTAKKRIGGEAAQCWLVGRKPFFCIIRDFYS